MTRGLLLVADGANETHLDYAHYRLREDAVLVEIAAPGGDHITTSFGHERDVSSIDDLDPARRYDLVVIPGGESAQVLAEHRPTRRWLAAHLDGDGVVCTIAEGVRLLAAVDVLDGRLVTGPSALSSHLAAAGARTTDEAVTVDGSLVTVRDTDALAYGLAAALGNVVIRQDHADAARERPVWPDSDSR